MFQFNIVFGILITFASNAMINGMGDNTWRWMLGVEAIPALIYSLMCFGLPESTRWLIGRKEDREAGDLPKLRDYIGKPDTTAAPSAPQKKDAAPQPRTNNQELGRQRQTRRPLHRHR